MVWKKIGLIFNASNQYEWMFSHASNPVSLSLGGSKYRIYFSTRDAQKRSSIGYVDIDIEQPNHVLSLSERPALRHGEDGTFDDLGASVGCVLRQPDQSCRVYYLGWNHEKSAPFRNRIGMATGDENEFSSSSRVLVLDCNTLDPLTLSYPWVIYEESKYRMWYGSHLSWSTSDFEMLHVLRNAESDDGVFWRRDDREVLPLRTSEGEFAMARPCVVRHNGLYKMWFSYRSPLYRIGYAESNDGLNWTRMDDKAGLMPSKTGFDSESASYSTVFTHDENLFMLYNGNGYGATGFGIAVWT